ncbi:MAG: hypothetical protein H6581_30420 [Bacteroidia bacterium]|nr:hypothetical protein [Bacteroidia bacterium]
MAADSITPPPNDSLGTASAVEGADSLSMHPLDSLQNTGRDTLPAFDPAKTDSVASPKPEVKPKPVAKAQGKGLFRQEVGLGKVNDPKDVYALMYRLEEIGFLTVDDWQSFGADKTGWEANGMQGPFPDCAISKIIKCYQEAIGLKVPDEFIAPGKFTEKALLEGKGGKQKEEVPMPESNPDKPQSGPDYECIAREIFEAGQGWNTDEERIYTHLGMIEGGGTQAAELKKKFCELYDTDLETYLKKELWDIFGLGEESKALGMLNNGSSTQKGPYDEYSYEDQVDNSTSGKGHFSSFPGTINGTTMCNVTTLAMQLKYLSKGDDFGIIEAAVRILQDNGHSGDVVELKKMQLEDLLFEILKIKGDDYWASNTYWVADGTLPPNQHVGPLMLLGEMFTDYIEDAKYTNSGSTKEFFTEKIKPMIESGEAVMSSSWLTNGGHIVLVVDVLEDGVLINDPYGLKYTGGYLANGQSAGDFANVWKKNKTEFEVRLSHNASLLSELNNLAKSNGQGNFEKNLGELNFFDWAEVKKWTIGKWTMSAKSPETTEK